MEFFTRCCFRIQSSHEAFFFAAPKCDVGWEGSGECGDDMSWINKKNAVEEATIPAFGFMYSSERREWGRKIDMMNISDKKFHHTNIDGVQLWYLQWKKVQTGISSTPTQWIPTQCTVFSSCTLFRIKGNFRESRFFHAWRFSLSIELESNLETVSSCDKAGRMLAVASTNFLSFKWKNLQVDVKSFLFIIRAREEKFIVHLILN